MIEELLKLEAEIKKLGPVLQAIAIYDCSATRSQVIKLEFEVEFEFVVTVFREEAGPVFRWFYEQKRNPYASIFDGGLLTSEGALFSLVPKVINRYGFAIVMSTKSWQQFQSLTKKEETEINIFQPKVYFLNFDKRT